MEKMAIVRPPGEYVSKDVAVLSGVDGQPLAEVGQAPPLLVSRVIRTLRAGGPQATEDRLRALEAAGMLFAEADLGGETPQDYVRRVALATGLPISVVRATVPAIRERLAGIGDFVAGQRPVAAGRGAVRWVPRGRVLGVVAPGNHPGVHLEWLQALALGVRVAVRPGTRDPFTPRRLARALFEAGLARDWLAVLPGPHTSADALLREADFGLAYGGDSVVRHYSAEPDVLVRGPGRTKALVTGQVTEEVLDYLAGAVSEDAGVRCNNLSLVLCEADHQEVAKALAVRLARRRGGPVLDESAELPVYNEKDAGALHSALGSSAGPIQSPLWTDVGAGHVALRPAVLCREDPGVSGEMPFPCVWVAPWKRASGIAPLRDSLAVLVPGECGILDDLLDEPTIRTVVSGIRPDWWNEPSLPHDGHLGQFLLEARGYVA